MAGIYIHIPFCKSKCPYCDFYSYRCSDKQKQDYINALLNEIKNLSGCKEFINKPIIADSLYIGGGTPSVLSGEKLSAVINCAKEKFSIPENAEITVECNPGSDIEEIAPYLKKAGVNRISLGLQSAVEKERKNLGRSAGKERITRVIEIFKENGIENISLDVMLGIPFQTPESLKETLDFVIKSGAKHISAYILKIEEGTHFGNHPEKYEFPDEDTVSELYLQCSETLKHAGYSHYEISNFAIPGYESRHNSKYWLLEDYLGIGPAAHSFIGGKRFYYESNTDDFISGKPAVFDCLGGDTEEYIMLRLRLKEGLKISELSEKHGEEYIKKIIKKAPILKDNGLIDFDGENLSLTEKGFLISNSIIAELI